MRATIVIACALALGGCGDSNQTASLEGAQAAWKAAGVEDVTLEATEARFGAESCKAGAASGVDVMLCEFADAEAAEKAEERGLRRVGDHTGASLARGELLLVVADRDGVDPKGKTINTLAKTFRELEVGSSDPAEEPEPAGGETGDKAAKSASE